MTPDVDGDLYIHGYYHGYNDGTTNDTLQRFVTRLYGPNFTTGVVERPAAEKKFNTYPNPTNGLVTFAYDLEQPTKEVYVVVRDLFGRTVVQLPMKNQRGQLEFDTGGLAKGLYTVSFTSAGRAMYTDKLIVQ